MAEMTNMNPQNIQNYLWQSIVVTVLCCLPLGIPAIVYATKVNNALMQGDTDAARKASESAKMWCIISLVCGIVGGLAYAVIMAIAAAA